MLSIQIDEFVNGYSITAFENKTYIIREITETRLEALARLNRLVLDLIKGEKELLEKQQMGVI